MIWFLSKQRQIKANPNPGLLNLRWFTSPKAKSEVVRMEGEVQELQEMLGTTVWKNAGLTPFDES